MNLAELAIRNRLICTIVIVGVLAGGWYAYRNMARFEDPEFTIRTAAVVTRYPGATAEEVANEVTEALETAIQELEEVDEIVSTSSIGLSSINVDVKYEFSRTRADLELVWAKLRNRIRDARDRLPPGALEPVVNDGFGDVYGLYYLVTGEGFSPREVHDYAKLLRTGLLTVEDVGKVAILGGRTEAIYVEVSRERAAALGVSVDRIYADLARQNSVTPAGDVRVGDRRVAILPSGSIDSVAAIENVIVSPASVSTGASPSAGALVRLGDIAAVRRGYAEPPRMLVRYDGRPAVALGVANVAGANVAKMGAAIDAKLARTAATRPHRHRGARVLPSRQGGGRGGMELRPQRHRRARDRAGHPAGVHGASFGGGDRLSAAAHHRGDPGRDVRGRHSHAPDLSRRPHHRPRHVGGQRHRGHRGHPGGDPARAEEARRRPGDRRSHQMAAPRRHPRRDPRLRAPSGSPPAAPPSTPAICSGWC